jgi:ABC-2 type transport system ATP-binding protein
MLEADRLTRYYGAIPAVLGVSFCARPGEILGYLGPNGSGKSTTVKMLAGLLPPSDGSIRYKGEDIQPHLLEYRAIVGYVPEEAHVYTFLSAEEYLRLAGRLRGIPAAPLERRVDRFLTLLKLDAERHSALSTFSKGMRQKVLLAAALLHDPKIVILDEPASGLDVGAMLTLRAVVSGLAQAGRIVFYSSHEMDTVERLCSRIVILRAGKVVADDSPERLREFTQQASLEDAFARLAVDDNVPQLAGYLLEAMRL